MEQSLLQNWVRDSRKMDRNSHRELKYLVDKYPFFQVGHVLLLKNLHDIQSIRFREELRNSSLYISDRRKLFLLIQDQVKVRPFANETAKGTIEEEPIVPLSEKNKPVKSITEELLVLSDEIYSVEQEGETIEETINLGKSEKESEEIFELSEAENKGTGQPINNDESHSFTDWIKVVDEEKQSGKEGDKSQGKTDLIDSFIKNEPRIERNPKMAERQEDISLDSVRENDGFISETLASIYVKQELFDKAIAVYQKLMLKNPEKNTYFASQIERIEKLKKSK